MSKKFSRENIILLFKKLFPNKKNLDKISESSKGTLLYNGKEVSGINSDVFYADTTLKINTDSATGNTGTGTCVSYVNLNGASRPIIDEDGRKLIKELKDASITIDSALDPLSTNPVQNKAIYNTINIINEAIKKNADSIYIINNNIGSLSDLKTTEKSNLVAAINELESIYIDFKRIISDSITAKDDRIVIENPEEATGQDFIDAISQMSVGNIIVGGTGNTDKGFYIYNIENMDVNYDILSPYNTEMAQYQVMHIPNQSNEVIICSVNISDMLLGAYSLMIRCRTSLMINANLIRIKVLHTEVGTTLDPVLVQDAYIKGTDFNTADTFEMFGLTFNAISKLRDMRIEVYIVACTTELTVDIDYIMINNTFTAIGSLT